MPVDFSIKTWLRRDGVVLVFFLLLSSWMISPVLWHSRTRVLGEPGDNIQSVYLTGRVAEAIRAGAWPWADPQVNPPEGLPLVTADVPFLALAILAPVTWGLGPVFSYNLFILLTGWLSGYLCYLWLRQLTRDRIAGVVGGCVFLMAPFRLVHSLGHIQLMGTYGFPLFFWALDVMLDTPKPHIRHAAALAGAVLLLGASSQYFLVIGLLGGCVYTILILGMRQPRRWLLGGAAIGLGALLAAAPFWWGLHSGVYQTHSITSTRQYSADPMDFLVPTPLQWVWHFVWQQPRSDLWVEKSLYLGWVALALALVAVCGRDRLWGTRRLAWMGVALTGFVFALGTDLHWRNQPVQTDGGLWLPAAWLSLVPPLGLMRVWSRFGIVTILFVALLAGVGAGRILRRWPAYRQSVGWALVLLCVLDFWPRPLPSSVVESRSVDRWLAQQPGDFLMAFLPADDVLNYWALFGTLFHDKHIIGHNHPEHVPARYREVVAAASRFPHTNAIERLRLLGVSYLALKQDRVPDWDKMKAGLAQLPSAKVVAEFEDYAVVRLIPGAIRPDDRRAPPDRGPSR